MALSREKILNTAFDLLKQYGLADLSMRRLATELGVAPGAIYYHVKNKQELLASLASRMLAGVSCEGPTPGTALMAGASELYQQLAPVRESAEVIRMALAMRPDELTFIVHTQELLKALSLDAEQAQNASRTLLHLCLSLIEEEQTRALLSGADVPNRPPVPYIDAVRALLRGWAPRASSDFPLAPEYFYRD